MADVKDNDDIEELPPEEMPAEEQPPEEAPPPVEGEEQEVNLDGAEVPQDELPPEEVPPEPPAEEAPAGEAPAEEPAPEEPAPADASPPEAAAEGEPVAPARPASRVSKRSRIGQAAAPNQPEGDQPKKPSTLKKIIVFTSPVLLIVLVAGFFVAPVRDGKTPFRLLMDKISGGATPDSVRVLSENDKKEYQRVLDETAKLLEQVNAALPDLEKARALTDRDQIQKSRDQAEGHRAEVETKLKQTTACLKSLNDAQITDPDPKKFEDLVNKTNELHEKLKALVIELDNKIIAAVKPPPPTEGEETIIKSGPDQSKPGAQQPAAEKPENPYLKFKEGYWERRKTTQSGLESFTDVWIAELKEDSVTIESEVFASGTKMPGQRTTVEFKTRKDKKVGDDKVDVGGTTYDCEIREEGDTKIWIIASGTYKGTLVKTETGGRKTMTATELSQETINVRGKDFGCIVVTRETESGGTPVKTRTWESRDAAHGPVKAVTTMNIGGQELTSVVELVDFGDDPSARPDFPKPEETAKPKEEPLPVPKEQPKEAPPVTRKLENPYLKFKAGRWERRKMSQNNMTNFTDMWIVQVSEESVTIEGEVFTSGMKVPVQRTTSNFTGESKKVGDDKVDIGGATCDCEVWETGSSKTWVVASGPYKDVPVKSESDGKVLFRVIDLSQDTVTVKGTEFKCIVVTQEMENPQGKTVSKQWRCPDVALGPVKAEIHTSMGGMDVSSTQELVDWGDDPSTRPAFAEPKTEPPSQPREQPQEPPKTDPMAERLAQADADVRRGADLLREIRQATSPNPPSDPAARRRIAQQVRQAQELYGKVLEAYQASGDAKYQTRADKVRRVLESLANLAKKLE